jgi:exopolysaccharide production protein ExoQ
MLLLTVIIPLQVKSYSDEGNSPLLAQVVWSAAYLAAGFRLLALRRDVTPLVKASGILIAILALDFVSSLWSVSPSTTFKNAIELVGTTIVGVYVVARFRMSEFLTILMLFFAASAVMSAALIFGSPGRGRMFYGSGPWDGIYQDKNSLGAAMATAIIVYLIYLLRPGVPRKPLVFLALLFCGALLIGSNSITATLVCLGVIVAGVLAYACVSPRYGVAARALSIAVGVLGFIGFGLFGFDIGRVYALVGRSSTLTGRADFWPYLLEAIAARPILGYGYGAFFRSSASDDYLSYYVVEAGGWKPYHAHNSFLQTLLDTGYAGLGLLIWLLVSGLVRAFKFLMRERTILSLWPLLTILTLTLGSYSETYLGNFNTIEWILFVAALLYPLKESTARRGGNVRPLRA